MGARERNGHPPEDLMRYGLQRDIDERARRVLDNAAEQIGPLPTMLDATPAAIAAVREDMLAAFVPGPPHPVPPPQDWPHANIVRRSIAGDDEDATPHLPSLREFMSAAAASGDWGTPVRSSSDPDRFGKGAMRGSGGRPHDPHAGREQYALAERELRRIGETQPARYGLTGEEQLACWMVIAGAGRLKRRNIHAGARPDAIEREQRRAAKRTKGKARAMEPPPKRKAVLVPERAGQTATTVALYLREQGVWVTPHQVGLVCRSLTARVRAVFEARNWIAPMAKRDESEPEKAAKGASMAAPKGYDLSGWKPILDVIGCSANTARKLMKRTERRLPVLIYLGTPCAKSAELRAWQDAEIEAAIAESCSAT